MRRFLLATALSAACAANAATIHQCLGADGGTVWRDSACVRGERTMRSWDAPADPPVALRPARATAGTSQRPRRVSARRARAVAAAAPDPCRAAKDRRDAIERRVGLARTYELLSALQREVYDACR